MGNLRHWFVESDQTLSGVNTANNLLYHSSMHARQACRPASLPGLVDSTMLRIRIIILTTWTRPAEHEAYFSVGPPARGGRVVHLPQMIAHSHRGSRAEFVILTLALRQAILVIGHTGLNAINRHGLR